MDRMRLDVYEQLPSGMSEYLSSYGWHFSKKLAEYAVARMKNAQNKHFTNEQVMEVMKQKGFSVEKAKGYDVYYLFNMFYSDFYPNTFESDTKIASAVNDTLNDIDGYEGKALTRYYADCIGKGDPINWEKFM